MVAEDHAGSYKNASAIYACIKNPLVDPSVSSARKLPLVYVIDSILKNVGGHFVTIIHEDAKNWLPIVYSTLPPDQQAKLKKVWNLWKGIFDDASWKEMGSCFLTNIGVAKLAASQVAVAPVAGIPRAVRQVVVIVFLEVDMSTRTRTTILVKHSLLMIFLLYKTLGRRHASAQFCPAETNAGVIG
jgi:hypothetical protein